MWAYQRDFWPGMLGYCVILLVVLVWGHLDGPSPWRYVWAVAPVVPAAWIVRAVLRHIGRIDEYQRLVLSRGLAGGFASAMIAAVTMGFLGLARLPVPMFAAGWIIYGVGMMGWVITGALAGRA